MTELDQVWVEMLADAEARAKAAGRDDLAEYLRLKATNDAIRNKAVNWLVDTFVEAAATAMQNVRDLVVEREDGHTFRHGNSNMVGIRLTCRRGVRVVTVEAGWVRGPGDGIMRGQALAVARISHFGRPRESIELRLVFADKLPSWLSEDANEAFTAAAAARHIAILLQ